ncbi:MAG: ribonuclease III [Aggregatilineales bacterium]
MSSAGETNISSSDSPAWLRLAFRDLKLWQRAITHRSYVNEHGAPPGEDPHNERLEFLGDAVLDFVVGEWLYSRLPDAAEGKLTRLRSSLVRTDSLAAIATQAGVGALLRLGKGEADSGGRERPTNLCGAFEAICGALYLDQGVDAVREFALPRLTPRLEQILQEETDKDAKSRLQEWAQTTLGQTPKYRISEEIGPEHAREFTVEVLLGDLVSGIGHGLSKRRAEQAAARAALDLLQSEQS